MITRLIKIENGGIFENYTPKALPNFKKYNLFYGWNGSGKSTLAKIFWHLENKVSLDHLDNLRYQFELSGNRVDETTQNLPCKFFVFNSQFVKDNTDFVNTSTASIAYIGKEKIEIKQKIELLGKQILDRKNELQQQESATKQISKSIDDHFISCGKAIRDLHSKSIYSKDDITKAHALKIWETVIKSGNSYDDFILENDEFSDHFNIIKQTEDRKELPLMEILVDAEIYKYLYNEYQKLLWTNPVRTSIDRLRKNPEIQSWVYEGMIIHERNNSFKCEYCDQEIPATRQQQLSTHFNDEFINLQKEIDTFIVSLEKLKIQVPTYNMRHLFSRYLSDFSRFYQEVTNDVRNINSGLDEWIENLQLKKQNPLKIEFTARSINGGYNVGSSQSMLNGVINRHNNAVIDFLNEAQKSRSALDSHIVARMSKDFELLKKYQAEELAKKAVYEIQGLIDIFNWDLLNLQRELADDTLVLANLNNDLHRFMGRSEISLEKKSEGGYIILRSGRPATNLSEGEKTAISLVYFIHKLSELENKLSDTIVVLDDPISSFDSNHLFTACSYVMNNCSETKQLFILTHNFWFFKLLRDWMLRRMKENCEFFSVKRGNIFAAEPALIKHHSEYHFIFSTVLSWSDSEHISWEENFSIANCCRRLLESFNAFKTPSTTSFNEILQKAVNKGFPKDTKDQIFFFLHKYSHLDRIEAIDGTIENVEGEGKKIASTTLALIKFLDPEHYDSMTRLCGEKEVESV